MAAEGRDELPRISVDTLQAWQRIKREYAQAARTILDGRLAGLPQAKRARYEALLSEVRSFAYGRWL